MLQEQGVRGRPLDDQPLDSEVRPGTGQTHSTVLEIHAWLVEGGRDLYQSQGSVEVFVPSRGFARQYPGSYAER
jgi:hypothetical protein